MTRTQFQSVAVTPRHRNITSSGFDTLLQEQESDDQVHAGEILSYLAIESGYGDGWDAARFGGVTQQSKSVPLIGGFSDVPVFLASMQSFNGWDTAALRYGRANNGSVSMWLNVEEEKSKDTEVKHYGETVGYLAHVHGDLLGQSWSSSVGDWILPGWTPTAVTPEVPTGLALASTPYTDAVDLIWNAPATQPNHYLIEWSSDGTEWFVIDEVAGGETAYTDEYPTLFESFYSIRAVNELYDAAGDLLDSAASVASASLPVDPIAPPVAWGDDNGGPNERGTLSPFATLHDTPIALNVLANDADYDDTGTLMIDAITTLPQHGTVTIQPDGTLLYTPDPGFAGTDTFEYTITDGEATSAPGKVAVDVTNAVPVAEAAYLRYEKHDYDRAADSGSHISTGDGLYDQLHRAGTPFGALWGTDEDGDDIYFAIEDAPEHGSVTIDPVTADVVYTPDATFRGLDRFTYIASDGMHDSTPASVVIDGYNRSTDILYNGGPTWWFWSSTWSAPAQWSVAQLSNGGFNAGRWSFPWDLRDQTGSLSLEIVDAPSQGLFSVDPDTGNLAFTPHSNFTGDDDFTLMLHNGGMSSQPIHGSFMLHQEPVGFGGSWDNYWSTIPDSSLQPTFVTVHPEQNTIRQGHEVAGTVALKQSGSLYAVTHQPEHGTITIDDAGNYLIYDPNYDPQSGEEPFLGVDKFAFVATHNGVAHPEEWVSLKVSYDSVPSVLPAPPSLPDYFTQPGQNIVIAPTYDGIAQGISDAHAVLSNLFHQFALIGQRIGNLSGIPDADEDAILAQETQISEAMDPLEGMYDQYFALRIALNRASADFVAGQWWVSEADGALIDQLNLLPLGIGTLKPNAQKMQQEAASLLALGNAAGVAADFSSNVYTTAIVTKNVLDTATMVAGGAGLAYTGGKLLFQKAYCEAAKKAAVTAMAFTGSALAAELVNVAADVLGLSEETRYWIGIGVDALQLFLLIKAMRAGVQPGGACFVAGTQVVTGQSRDGTLLSRNIEDIRVGDFVLARDQNDAADDLDLRRVTNVFRKTSDHLRTVVIEGDGGNIETIRTTDEHPFYVDGRGWIGAGDLQAGDRVQETDGTWQTVLRSVREDFAGGVSVYNFEVEGDHTYFVEDGVGAADAVWVHNAQDYGNHPDLNPNKIIHIWDKPAHNLDPLLAKLGTKEKAQQALIAAVQDLSKRVALTTTPSAHVVPVGGTNVTVEVLLVDGIPRIGTAYIP